MSKGKRSQRPIHLNKKSVRRLTETEVEKAKGGTFSGKLQCVTSGANCDEQNAI